MRNRNMKKILITGQNSYIGNAVAEYLEEWNRQQAKMSDGDATGEMEPETDCEMYRIDKISLQSDTWQTMDFSGYDAILHVAGKAHVDVTSVSEEAKELYYQVNGELPAKVAEKAKAEGVKQFIHLSSVIIYGDSAPVGKTKMITKDTIPNPTNFYGDSKLQGEEKLKPLADEHFKVAILRLPFVYGKNSKGNYPLLAKLADKTPIFPDVNNQRSMLYVENLAEFIRLLVERGEGGLFFPQNAEYTTTAHMVQQIGAAKGKKIQLWGILNPAVWLASKVPGKIGVLANKAFGSLAVARTLSGLASQESDSALAGKMLDDYQKYSLEESIRRIHED